MPRIPADVDRPDRVLLGLTARQVTVIATAAGLAWAGWWVTRACVPTVVYLVVAIPVVAATGVVVTVRRDGLSLDALLWAGLRHRLSPRRWFAHGYAPRRGGEGGAGLPVAGVDEHGVLDLGEHGAAVIAACSTVNFALRSRVEQQALIGVCARWLHSTTMPVQIVVRAQRLDVASHTAAIRAHAPALPHPALAAAAAEHADFVDTLADHADLLRRQVLLVLRDPARLTDATRTRLHRRVAEAADALAPAGIEVRALDVDQTLRVISTATRPGSFTPVSAGTAPPDEVVTAHPEEDT